LLSNLGAGELEILEELDNSGALVHISELASKFKVGLPAIQDCLDALKQHRYIESTGFFKTARLGVEDSLTLFWRQTRPIDDKDTEKSL
jgi:hypothetical protein